MKPMAPVNEAPSLTQRNSAANFPLSYTDPSPSAITRTRTGVKPTPINTQRLDLEQRPPSSSSSSSSSAAVVSPRTSAASGAPSSTTPSLSQQAQTASPVDAAPTPNTTVSSMSSLSPRSSTHCSPRSSPSEVVGGRDISGGNDTGMSYGSVEAPTAEALRTLTEGVLIHLKEQNQKGDEIVRILAKLTDLLSLHVQQQGQLLRLHESLPRGTTTTAIVGTQSVESTGDHNYAVPKPTLCVAIYADRGTAAVDLKQAQLLAAELHKRLTDTFELKIELVPSYSAVAADVALVIRSGSERIDMPEDSFLREAADRTPCGNAISVKTMRSNDAARAPYNPKLETVKAYSSGIGLKSGQTAQKAVVVLTFNFPLDGPGNKPLHILECSQNIDNLHSLESLIRQAGGLTAK